MAIPIGTKLKHGEVSDLPSVTQLLPGEAGFAPALFFLSFLTPPPKRNPSLIEIQFPYQTGIRSRYASQCVAVFTQKYDRNHGHFENVSSPQGKPVPWSCHPLFPTPFLPTPLPPALSMTHGSSDSVIFPVLDASLMESCGLCVWLLSPTMMSAGSIYVVA